MLAAAPGCGATEESGEIGDVLSAEGLQVSVERVDTRVPVPAEDITGLSQPSPGTKLVGVLARVCSDHRGAIGAYDFGLESSEGDGRLKFPQRNYRDDFEVPRADCGGGWIVFEIPSGAEPERVRFDFQDTGSSRDQDQNVDAEFSWSV
jgi:hypothetical protein